MKVLPLTQDAIDFVIENLSTASRDEMRFFGKTLVEALEQTVTKSFGGKDRWIN